VGLHQEGITERHLETAEPTREAKLEVTAVPIRGKITQQNVNLRILTLPPGPKRPLQALQVLQVLKHSQILAHQRRFRRKSSKLKPERRRRERGKKEQGGSSTASKP
jgi:hypothetical protein